MIFTREKEIFFLKNLLLYVINGFKFLEEIHHIERVYSPLTLKMSACEA